VASLKLLGLLAIARLISAGLGGGSRDERDSLCKVAND
jgi:hypothetical protein